MRIKTNSDILFKAVILIFSAYLLYLLTLITIQMKKNADVGRYQFRNEGPFIIDTKTGEVKRFSRP